MGVHLIGVYLMGVYLTGVHLMWVYLINVHLTGVHLMGGHSKAAVIVVGLASFETNGCVLTLIKETNVLSS